MTQPRQISFDQYLDFMFASPDWLDACVNMLAVFLGDIDACRDNPDQSLPSTAPSIVDQVSAVARRAKRLELDLRGIAERHGPEFQTSQLGAILWWTGMALHKAAGAREAVAGTMARNAWEEALFDVHALMYETISALSLLSTAEGMIQRMEAEGVGRERPN